MNNAYMELRTLFGRSRPSVKRFYKILSKLSVEEQNAWYCKACFVAMNHWDMLPVWYQTFLINLVKHDWQQFLDYVRKTSVLGNIPYQLKDKKIIRQIFGLLARLPRKKGHPASCNHIAFVFSLGFGSKEKINYISHLISEGLITPEDLQEMKGKATVDC